MSCSDLIKIYRGSDKNIIVSVKKDLTLATKILARFETDTGSYYAKYLKKSGDIASASPTVSNIDVTDIAAGDPISGVGIPAGTTVIAVGSGSLTMSANATASTSALDIVVGNIAVSVVGVISAILIALKSAYTANFKIGTKSIGFDFVVDGFTSSALASNVLEVLADPCP